MLYEVITIPPGETYEAQVRWEPGPDYYGAPPTGTQMSVVSSDNEHTPWNIDLYGDRLISRLPVSIRLVLESVLRNCDVQIV